MRSCSSKLLAIAKAPGTLASVSEEYEGGEFTDGCVGESDSGGSASVGSPSSPLASERDRDSWMALWETKEKESFSVLSGNQFQFDLIHSDIRM